jgi:hypothetical protein
MKSFAILDPEGAAGLVAFLTEHLIQTETRAVTEENGFDAVEVFVVDHQYQQACDLSEQWQGSTAMEDIAKTLRPCPKCRAPQALEPFQDEHYKKVELVVLRCRFCGEAFPFD